MLALQPKSGWVPENFLKAAPKIGSKSVSHFRENIYKRVLALQRHLNYSLLVMDG